MYSLGIVGSRNFNDYNLFKILIDEYIEDNGKPSKIISGGASGADSLAKRYAIENNIDLIEYKPDWSLGKKAGPIRNSKIVENCDCIIAFPSRSGRGTQDTINKSQNKNIPVKIIYID